MKFSYISNKVDAELADASIRVFTRLFVELGLRSNNRCIGSGLGGNNFQLFVLMGLKHKLINSQTLSIEFDKNKNTVVWGSYWLIRTPMEIIRQTLNEVFTKINEANKYSAMAMLAESGNLRKIVYEYEDQFPQLIRMLSGKTYQFDESLSPRDQLILACLMCQELAASLDSGDKSKIQIIGSALVDFPHEIILVSVRRELGISRLVKFDLDEDPIFNKCLVKVTKVLP